MHWMSGHCCTICIFRALEGRYHSRSFSVAFGSERFRASQMGTGGDRGAVHILLIAHLIDPLSMIREILPSSVSQSLPHSSLPSLPAHQLIIEE